MLTAVILLTFNIHSSIIVVVICNENAAKIEYKINVYLKKTIVGCLDFYYTFIHKLICLQ